MFQHLADFIGIRHIIEFRDFVWLTCAIMSMWMLTAFIYFANLASSRIRIAVFDIIFIGGITILLIVVVGFIYHYGVDYSTITSVPPYVDEILSQGSSRTPLVDAVLSPASITEGASK